MLNPTDRPDSWTTHNDVGRLSDSLTTHQNRKQFPRLTPTRLSLSRYRGSTRDAVNLAVAIVARFAATLAKHKVTTIL